MKKETVIVSPKALNIAIKASGLSIRRFAKGAGLSHKTILRALQFDRVERQTLVKICEAYSLPLSDMLGHEELQQTIKEAERQSLEWKLAQERERSAELKRQRDHLGHSIKSLTEELLEAERPRTVSEAWVTLGSSIADAIASRLKAIFERG